MLDAFVLAREGALLRRLEGSAWVVDLGFGANGHTTVELAEGLRRAGYALPVLGVEADAARVYWSHRLAREGVEFRQGGFTLPMAPGEAVGLIRAMNVLRQYPAQEVPAIHAALGASLVEGGLVIEGTSSAPGDVIVAHLLRRRGEALVREALVFLTRFARGFAPIMFRDQLPRELRRAAQQGQVMAPFFAAWTAAWEEARAEGAATPALAFRESGLRLAAQGLVQAADVPLLDQGALVWTPPGGVPSPHEPAG